MEQDSFVEQTGLRGAEVSLVEQDLSVVQQISSEDSMAETMSTEVNPGAPSYVPLDHGQLDSLTRAVGDRDGGRFGRQKSGGR